MGGGGVAPNCQQLTTRSKRKGNMSKKCLLSFTLSLSFPRSWVYHSLLFLFSLSLSICRWRHTPLCHQARVTVTISALCLCLSYMPEAQLSLRSFPATLPHSVCLLSSVFLFPENQNHSVLGAKQGKWGHLFMSCKYKSLPQFYKATIELMSSDSLYLRESTYKLRCYSVTQHTVSLGSNKTKSTPCL